MRTHFFTALLILPLYIYGQQVRVSDKACIAEAVNISNTFGEQLWKGFNKVPFSLLLVTEDYEYLMFHDNPTDDFKLLENDKVLKTKIYYRDRKFSKNLLATFQAVNGANCIVVGTPENTGKSTSEWIITLVHEHFHQYSYGSKNYHKEVAGLDLANGDKTGMWMLNYAFPYDDETVIDAYNNYTNSVKGLVAKMSNGSDYKKELKAYKKNRKSFKNILDSNDYKYFSFQLWQEGVARYTEYKFLELLDDYTPSEAVKNMNDFMPFSKLKTTLKERALNNLTALHLNESKRVCFYAVGMAEGLVLDKLNPNWRQHYLTNKFFLENYR